MCKTAQIGVSITPLVTLRYPLCEAMLLPLFVSLFKCTVLKMSFCLKVFNSPPFSFAWLCVYACVFVRLNISDTVYRNKQEL